MKNEMPAGQAAVVLERLVEAIEGRIDETRAICAQYEGRVDVFKTFGQAAYDACNVRCGEVELLTLEEILEMIEDLSFELATQGDDCPQA